MGAGKSKKISVEGVQDGSGNASNDENNELSKSTSSSYLDDDDFGDAPEFLVCPITQEVMDDPRSQVMGTPLREVLLKHGSPTIVQIR